MKRYLSFILIYCACTGAAFPQQTDPPAPSVIYVATALNHLTILEFHEPVTMAAAGSSDFQIERQENKVFVKPMKSGASTDLFVWTASRRFAYELETTQEVKSKNFAIDNAPSPAAHLVVSPSTDQLADLMLTRAFLGTVEITSVNTRPSKNRVGVRVEQVFRTRSSVYIHYTIENNSKSSYHVAATSAYQVQGDHSSISLSSLAHKQLDPRLLEKLVSTQNVSLPIAHAESAAEDLAPGEATQGVGINLSFNKAIERRMADNVSPYPLPLAGHDRSRYLRVFGQEPRFWGKMLSWAKPPKAPFTEFHKLGYRLSSYAAQLSSFAHTHTISISHCFILVAICRSGGVI